MSTSFGADVRDEIDNVVEHFNGNHADTVQLIAQELMPQAACTEAQIARVTPEQIVLETRDASGVSSLTALELPGKARDLATLQQGLMALLAQARSAAAADTPLTSLEAEIAHTQTLATYHTEVVATEMVAPGIRQLTVRGGLEAFQSPGWDAFVLVITPPDGMTELPDDFTMASYRSWQEEPKPGGAYYTIRQARENELDLWFVLHGDEGAVSRWATAAEPGARVVLWGPRVAFNPPPGTRRYLLIGDETAQPAIAAIIDGLEEGCEVRALLETQRETTAAPVPARAPGANRWCYRGDAAPGTSDVLLTAVQNEEIDPDGLYVFGAAATKRIAEIRRFLKQERGVPNSQMHLTGYWRAPR
ncbi:MAG: siderophore-interacting protein [Pseudomonadota bacterium]